jgi:hypothetical protein
MIVAFSGWNYMVGFDFRPAEPMAYAAAAMTLDEQRRHFLPVKAWRHIVPFASPNL